MKPRWREGCRGMLTVTGIFAGLSAAVAVNAFTREIPSNLEAHPIEIARVLGLAAFALFAVTAEKLTDALDDGSVDTYLKSMTIYNFGVVLVYVCVGLVLVAAQSDFLAACAWGLVAVPWLRDICFLVLKPEVTFDWFGMPETYAEYRARLMIDENAE